MCTWVDRIPAVASARTASVRSKLLQFLYVLAINSLCLTALTQVKSLSRTHLWRCKLSRNEADCTIMGYKQVITELLSLVIDRCRVMASAEIKIAIIANKLRTSFQHYDIPATIMASASSTESTVLQGYCLLLPKR